MNDTTAKIANEMDLYLQKERTMVAASLDLSKIFDTVDIMQLIQDTMLTTLMTI